MSINVAMPNLAAAHQEQGQILRSQLLLARDVFVAAQPPTQG